MNQRSVTTKVILLGHKSQVGKDTLADQIIKNNDLCFRVAFADKLKSVSMDLFNLSDDQVHGSSKNTPDPRFQTESGILTPRRILQVVGQDMRAIYPNVWASYIFDTLIPSIEQTFISEPGERTYIVSDFRFPNEYKVAKEWESADPYTRRLFTAKIERPSLELEFAGKTDISETALDDFQHWDACLINDGSIEDLYNQFVIWYNNTDQISNLS